MKATSFNTGWTCRHLGSSAPGTPVTLPHDAMLAEERSQTSAGGTNTGWFAGYDYLYEKHFTPDAAQAAQCAVLEFEGVYHNAEVHLNGEKIASCPYGYSDFYGSWRLSAICLYCSSSAPPIASLPDSKIRYVRAPIYSFS